MTDAPKIATAQQIHQSLIPKQSVPFYVEYFAGWIGGIGQVLTAQPFDIIKVRLQTQDPANPKFTGMTDCFRKIIAADGLTGFYKGTLTPLIGVGTICAIQFMVFQKTREFLATLGQDKDSDLTNFISGGMGGLMAAPVVTMVEHCRIRMQIQGDDKLYKGSLDAGKKIWGQFGTRGLFKGYVATVIRDVPFFGVYYCLYEWVVRQFKTSATDEPGILSILAGGSFCGSIGWALSFPTDSLKSIAQTDDFANPKYKNYRDMVGTVLREKGPGQLYRGLGVCMLRSVPVNAVTFLFYELAKKDLFGYK